MEKVRYGGPGVVVWGGIMLNGRTDLHIFDTGILIGVRYCQEVILPDVRLFTGAIGADILFMDGNARSHLRTHAVQQLHERENITSLNWHHTPAI